MEGKQLRRQQYARGRRKGTKGVKTGASVARGVARDERQLARRRVGGCRWPPAVESEPAPARQATPVHESSARLYVFVPGSAPLLRRRKQRVPLRRLGGGQWQFYTGAMGPWSVEPGGEWVWLDERTAAALEGVQWEQEVWVYCSLSEDSGEDGEAPRRRGRGRRGRRGKQDEEEGDGEDGEDEEDDGVVHGGWHWAVAASHRRNDSAAHHRAIRAARARTWRELDSRGVSGKHRVPPPAPEELQRPLPVSKGAEGREEDEPPPAVVVLRRGASLVEEEIRERRYLPPRLWLRVLQMVGSLSVGLVMSRNIGDAVRDHVTALRVQAPRAWPRVVDLDRWPRVRALTLVNAQFGGVQGLCRSVDPGFLARLRRLVLDGCGIEDDGAHELAAALAAGRFPALRVLRLRANRFTLDGMRALVDALLQHAPELRVLDLSEVLDANDTILAAHRLFHGVSQGALPRLRFVRLDVRRGDVHVSLRLLDVLKEAAGRRGGQLRVSIDGVRLPEEVGWSLS